VKVYAGVEVGDIGGDDMLDFEIALNQRGL
jgi:hypothetical protein